MLPSPFEFQNDDCQLQELSHKKLIDLFAAAQWLPFNHQNRNRLRAAERDQFLFIVGIFPDVFLDDLAEPCKYESKGNDCDVLLG